MAPAQGVAFALTEQNRGNPKDRALGSEGRSWGFQISTATCQKGSPFPWSLQEPHKWTLVIFREIYSLQ